MKPLVILTLGLFLLSACQTSSTVRETSGHNNFVQLQGATLQLNTDLEISAERARIFIQGGRTRSGFNSYQPHCAFEIDNVRHDGAVIRAGAFTVTSVQQTIDEVVRNKPLMLASLQQLASVSGGGSASYYAGYHFWLSSADQPQVSRMTCYGVYAQPYELHPPTVAEIRDTLGSIATLN